jgi:hypothetical protein
VQRRAVVEVGALQAGGDGGRLGLDRLDDDGGRQSERADDDPAQHGVAEDVVDVRLALGVVQEVKRVGNAGIPVVEPGAVLVFDEAAHELLDLRVLPSGQTPLLQGERLGGGREALVEAGEQALGAGRVGDERLRHQTGIDRLVGEAEGGQQDVQDARVLQGGLHVARPADGGLERRQRGDGDRVLLPGDALGGGAGRLGGLQRGEAGRRVAGIGGAGVRRAEERRHQGGGDLHATRQHDGRGLPKDKAGQVTTEGPARPVWRAMPAISCAAAITGASTSCTGRAWRDGSGSKRSR